jgi:hypothetical protein
MTKEKAKEMADCYAAYGAALASFAAGEPDGEHKFNEVREKFGSKVKQFAAEDGPPETQMPGGAFASHEGGGSEETELPAESLSEGEEPPHESEFSAENFSALQQQVSSLTRRLSVVEKAKAALAGRLVKSEYEKKRDELLSGGHQFDAAAADLMFSNVSDSRNPVESLKRLYAFLEKTPKRDSLSAVGQVFGADAAVRPGSNGQPAQMTEKEIGALQDEIYNATGRSYTAEELKLGEVFASIGSMR